MEQEVKIIEPNNETGESTDTVTKDSLVTSVFDEETMKNLDLFKHQTELNDINKLLNSVNAKMNDPLKGNENLDEVVDYIDSVIETYTVEDIKKLSDDEIRNIFVRDAEITGSEIKLDIGEDKTKDIEFKRDFLIYRKEMMETTKSLQNSVKELNEYMSEYTEDMAKLNEEYQTMENYIIDALDKKIAENNETPERMALLIKIKNAYMEAFTLEGLTDFVKSYKGKDILANFLNHDKTMKIYNRYIKINKKLNISRDLTYYAGLERFLYDEEQLKTVRVNIFIFAVINYITSKRYDELDNTFSIFISQLTTNIKNIIYGNNANSDNQLKFMDNIRHIVEIIG